MFKNYFTLFHVSHQWKPRFKVIHVRWLRGFTCSQLQIYFTQLQIHFTQLQIHFTQLQIYFTQLLTQLKMVSVMRVLVSNIQTENTGARAPAMRIQVR